MIAILFLSLISSIAPVCSSYAGDRAGNGGDTTLTNPISELILTGDVDHISGYVVCRGQEFVHDRRIICNIFTDLRSHDGLHANQRNFFQHCCNRGFNIDLTP